MNRGAPKDRDVARVGQNYALYPHVNVAEHMAFGLRIRRMPKGQIATTIAETAAILGLTDYLERRPADLSGGQRQRVAMGRAIVRHPKVFLFDEPLSNLDAKLRTQMRAEIKRLHNRRGVTSVYVTHDQLEAMQMGDKIVVMNNAVVEQFGTPQEIYDKPATMFVADFIGSPSMNFIPFHGKVGTGDATLAMHHADFAVPTLREPFEGDMALGVRTERLRLSDATPFRGKVLATEYLGTTQIVTLDIPGGEIKARVPAATVARAGESVGLEFNGATVTLFDRQSGRALKSELNEGVLHG